MAPREGVETMPHSLFLSTLGLIIAWFLVAPSVQASLGDLDGDGRLTLQDLHRCLRLAAGLDPITPEILAIADVYPNPGDGGRRIGDGKITLKDAQQILRRVLRLISEFDFLPPPEVITIAGRPVVDPSNPLSFQAIDGPKGTGTFGGPWLIRLDTQGNMYVSDYDGQRIRKVTPDGTIITLAGSGIRGYKDGPALQSQFNYPIGVAVAPDGSVYVGDFSNHCIRKITVDRQVITFAGSTQPGFIDGPLKEARFNGPMGLDIDKQGNIYVADTGNHAIRKITPEGIVTTLAGGGPLRGVKKGKPGLQDGPVSEALFRSPSDVVVTEDGTLYVADWDNHRIRKITPEGWVITIAGASPPNRYGRPIGGYKDGTVSEALFSGPFSVAVDKAGNIFVADWYNDRIRVITPDGFVRTLAGTDGPIPRFDRSGGYRDGPAHQALFLSPMGVAVDEKGNVYVADSDNTLIRKIIRFP